MGCLNGNPKKLNKQTKNLSTQDQNKIVNTKEIKTEDQLISQFPGQFATSSNNLNQINVAQKESTLHVDEANNLLKTPEKDYQDLPHLNVPTPAETRMTNDSLSNLELKANFYFDSNQARVSYILLDSIYNLSSTQIPSMQSKDDFLNYCKNEGVNYEKISSIFEDTMKVLQQDLNLSSPQLNAIQWYTKESFLYTLINNTFRTGNYQKIFQTRYFVHLLSQQLNAIEKPTLTQLFRGTQISKEEFQVFHGNLHKPILLRGFISTSGKRSVAENFLIKRKSNDEMFKLLLVINADSNHQHMFHSIKKFSLYPDEDEYLLNIYSIITVESITKKDNLVEAQCNLSDFQVCKQYFDDRTLKFKDDFQVNVRDQQYPNDNFFLFDIYFQIPSYGKCIEILNEITDQSDKCISAKYNNLGLVYKSKGDYINALKYYGESLTITISTYGENHQKTATSYNNISVAYKDSGDYENAIKYSEKSLNIQLKTCGENHSATATSYNNMALIYKAKGDNETALKYHMKSLNIRISILGENHPEVATSYNNIAGVYYAQGDYVNALKYYEKSLNILISTLGEKHPNTAACYNNLGNVYDRKGDCENAVKYYKKSLKIKIATYGENHPSIATSYSNIGEVYQAIGCYNKALKYYQKDLNITLSTLGEKHKNTAISYSHLGLIYETKGDYENSLKYLEKSLNIRISILGEKHPETASSYNLIGNVALAKGDYENALNYYEKSLNIRISTLGEKHPDTATSYFSIGNVAMEKGDYENALKYYENSLNIRISILGENHPSIAACYNKIAQIYAVKGDKENANRYFNKIFDDENSCNSKNS